MNCTRCGGAEAVVKRDAAFYCGKCALARDWEEVIALVQEERVMVAQSTVDFGGNGDGTPAEAPAEDAEPAKAGASDLPADPFA